MAFLLRIVYHSIIGGICGEKRTSELIPTQKGDSTSFTENGSESIGYYGEREIKWIDMQPGGGGGWQVSNIAKNAWAQIIFFIFFKEKGLLPDLRELSPSPEFAPMTR